VILSFPDALAQAPEAPPPVEPVELADTDQKDPILDLHPINEYTVELYKQLAYLYAKMGEKQKALEIYQAILNVDPSNQENWLAVIYSLYDLQLEEKVPELVQTYLKRFPEDTEQAKSLCYLYLYQKKKLDELPFYVTYISKSKDEDFAKDVTYSLINAKKTDEALQWIKLMQQIFPENSKWATLYVEVLLSEKRYTQAIETLKAVQNPSEEQKLLLADLYELNKDYQASLAIYQEQLQSNPNQPSLLSKVAQLNYLLGNREASLAFYQKLSESRPNDPAIQKQVGMEYLFNGNPRKALEVLERASQLDPKDPEIWYWLSESASSNTQPELALDYAAKARDLFAAQTKLSQSHTRMFLKTKGRWGLDAPLESEYRAALARWPEDLDLRFDWVDVLVLNKRLEQAEEEIVLAKQKGPVAAKRSLPYEAVVAFQKQEWKRAQRLLIQILEEVPNQWSYRRDLAEAYWRTGMLGESVNEYQAVFNATQDDLKVVEILQDLHHIYDYQLSAGYRYTQLGVDSIHLIQASGMGLITNHIQPKATADWGFYRQGNGTRTEALTGQVRFDYHLYPNWHLAAGAGYGLSSRLFQVGPSVLAQYRHLGYTTLKLTYEHQFLRTDLPQAVIVGTSQNRLLAEWEFIFWQWLVLSGHFQLLHNQLPSRDSALIYEATPTLSFIVNSDPYINLGYILTLSRVFKNTPNFLPQLNILPRVASHTLYIYFAQRVLKSFSYFISASTGFDPERKIKPFQQWAVSGGFRWHLTAFLDALAQAYYGSETLTGVSGSSYTIYTGLIVHWR
jgi:tetratricopeptide (TPR) repeat protein